MTEQNGKSPRDFDAEYLTKPGVSFVMGGQTFSTKNVIHPAVFRKTESLTGLDTAIAIIAGSLVPEDRERFEAMVEDEDSPISAFQLDGVAEWIIEEFSGRPTK